MTGLWIPLAVIVGWLVLSALFVGAWALFDRVVAAVAARIWGHR